MVGAARGLQLARPEGEQDGKGEMFVRPERTLNGDGLRELEPQGVGEQVEEGKEEGWREQGRERERERGRKRGREPAGGADLESQVSTRVMPQPPQVALPVQMKVHLRRASGLLRYCLASEAFQTWIHGMHVVC